MSKERILVVDDDNGFQEVIRRILQRQGFDVETVGTAEKALENAREIFPNTTLLDVSLPDISGTEVLSSLLELHPDTVVIMLTGHSSVTNAVQSLNRGAFAYLEKPVDPEHLLSVIARGLEKQRLVFENRRLVEELEQKNREMGILLAVSQSVSQSLELQKILDSALAKVAEAMSVEAGFLYLLENGQLLLKGSYGFTPENLQKMKVIRLFDITGDSSSILNLPLFVMNKPGMEQYGAVSLTKLGYKSYACVQLATADEPIGIMGVATTLEHNFIQREVELLNAIGREVTIAVRNAQLYEEASSAKALRELDTLRTELLANVSHELRTPLAAIKGFASALLQQDVTFDEETRREFIQTIDMESDRLNILIEELLTMSRLEAGVLELRKERRNIKDVVDSIRDRLFTLASKRKLKIMIPPDLPLVAVDDIRIGQVITNLVDNAVKYSDEGSLITLDARTEEDAIIISVKDEGIGIPAELREKIFERFYRVKAKRTANSRGAGLGLSVCRGIIEAHGGRIWVESDAGKGSDFRFSLPII